MQTLSAQKIKKRVLGKQAPTLMCVEEVGIRHAFSWIEVWQLFGGRNEIMGLPKGPMCLLHSCRAPVNVDEKLSRGAVVAGLTQAEKATTVEVNFTNRRFWRILNGLPYMGGKVFILPGDKAINKNSSARYLP